MPMVYHKRTQCPLQRLRVACPAWLLVGQRRQLNNRTHPKWCTHHCLCQFQHSTVSIFSHSLCRRACTTSKCEKAGRMVDLQCDMHVRMRLSITFWHTGARCGVRAAAGRGACAVAESSDCELGSDCWDCGERQVSNVHAEDADRRELSHAIPPTCECCVFN